MMEQITRNLRSSRAVFLATHTDPDGDAVGSLIALGLALEALNIRSTLYCDSPVPAVYRFLPSVQRIVRQLKKKSVYDTAVILDCGSMARIGRAASLVQELPTIINIDHHVTNTRFGTLQLIDTGACATAEIVHRLLKVLQIPISAPIATAIYTGILTDTGSFRFSNTNRAAFTICEEMVGRGVDPYAVAQHVYGTYSLGRIKLLNLALDSLEISDNGKLSLMALTQVMLTETGTQPEDIDGMINYARRIEDIKVAVLIQELPRGKKRRPGARPVSRQPTFRWHGGCGPNRSRFRRRRTFQRPPVSASRPRWRI